MLPWILERSSIAGFTVFAMESQVSGERFFILEASPHPPEASLEHGRVSRLALTLSYEFATAASARQSHENIIHARVGLVCQQQVGRKLTLFKIRGESIAALDARKVNAVVPNGCYMCPHVADHGMDQGIDAVSIEVADEQQIV